MDVLTRTLHCVYWCRALCQNNLVQAVQQVNNQVQVVLQVVQAVQAVQVRGQCQNCGNTRSFVMLSNLARKGLRVRHAKWAPCGSSEIR
jgi:hypothetical protein